MKTEINLTDLINKLAGTEGKKLAFSSNIPKGSIEVTETHIILGKQKENPSAGNTKAFG